MFAYFVSREKDGTTSFTSTIEFVSMVAVHTHTTEASESVKAICVGFTAVLVHSAFVYVCNYNKIRPVTKWSTSSSL